MWEHYPEVVINGDSPDVTDLLQAGGDLSSYVAERNAIFEPGDMSIGEGVDLCSELSDIIQLSRFIVAELRLDGHKLTRYWKKREVDR